MHRASLLMLMMGLKFRRVSDLGNRSQSGKMPFEISGDCAEKFPGFVQKNIVC